jgi:DhnA family fructose-bisphosphate aldolase class Ia
MNARPGLDQLGLSTGKKARLHRILHEHGLRNGTAIFLPYDQGLEHGPRDFFANPTASELGADVVKVNFPHPEKQSGAAEQYLGEFSPQEAIEAVVRSANRTLLLVSGGERAGDDAMIEKARESMEAGATGLIFGRNVWQREHDQSLRFVSQLKEILAKYPS